MSEGFGAWTVHWVVLKALMYALGTPGAVSFLELAAYSGYPFVAICLTMLAQLTLGAHAPHSRTAALVHRQHATWAAFPQHAVRRQHACLLAPQQGADLAGRVCHVSPDAPVLHVPSLSFAAQSTSHQRGHTMHARACGTSRAVWLCTAASWHACQG